MKIAWILLLALAAPTGCMFLHANIPEEAVRRHLAHEEGIELAAICSHEGRSFSQGAIACKAAQRMTCDATGSWVQDGSC